MARFHFLFFLLLCSFCCEAKKWMRQVEQQDSVLCMTCNGEGRMTDCTKCKGRGWIPHHCMSYACNRVIDPCISCECRTCKGNGYLNQNNKCRACRDLGTYDRPCGECVGTGKIPPSSDFRNRSKWKSCGTCKGTGTIKLKCPICKRDGNEE